MKKLQTLLLVGVPLLLLIKQDLCCLAQQQQPPPSGCETCQVSGNCQAAFKGGPGQFCGTFYKSSVQSIKPCCCPLQASCKVSSNTCLCHVASGGNNPAGVNSAGDQRTSSSNVSGITDEKHLHHYFHSTEPETVSLGALLFLALLVCCCCGGCRCCFPPRSHTAALQRSHQHYERYPIRASMSEATPMAPPPAYNPNYHRDGPKNYGATSYTNAYNGNPSGGGSSGFLSGVGGFLAGAGLGSFFTHQLDGRRGTGIIEGRGRGGSFDFAGDTDAGGGGGGYDIAGDDGDDGYDIAGDS